ncbi:hypothetical protein [Niabella drilacis]|uniref:Uncharacterized protein n=1 Tax=Niabella drilacis (strain DSM 25811 / CCM 8410 / CCUG 62505 / LMG 26954 / E90) TaxID=1285928 RepID=A0A1G6VT70_NIADE|nr:hypothetical protein [Niabella drilacis]SDD56187.1 hypothetical protein SAMN04487894_110125 [Niabella drilacis]
MSKISTFFDRLEIFSRNEGFNSINDFAINGLKYKSSQKLNRLRDGTRRPSLEIIEDIKNKFENVDLNWLIANKREKPVQGIDNVMEDPAPCKDCQWRDRLITSQEQTIKALHDKANALQLAMEILGRKAMEKKS